MGYRIQTSVTYNLSIIALQMNEQNEARGLGTTKVNTEH